MAIEFTNLVKDVEVLDSCQLTLEEREEFDCLDWAELDEGRDSASFVRYAGSTYLLSDFSADWGITQGTGLPHGFAGWDGYLSEWFSGGVVIRYRDADNDVVDLATFYVRD